MPTVFRTQSRNPELLLVLTGSARHNWPAPPVHSVFLSCTAHLSRPRSWFHTRQHYAANSYAVESSQRKQCMCSKSMPTSETRRDRDIADRTPSPSEAPPLAAHARARTSMHARAQRAAVTTRLPQARLSKPRLTTRAVTELLSAPGQPAAAQRTAQSPEPARAARELRTVCTRAHQRRRAHSFSQLPPGAKQARGPTQDGTGASRLAR